NTQIICRDYAEKYANVIYYHQGNKGAGRARNSVIPLCTGKYTYFLDADDVINAKSLEHAVKKAILEDADLLLMKYKIEYYDEKKTRGMFNADDKLWQSFEKEKHKIRNYASALINYPWNRIIKTDLLHDENIFFGPTVVHNDIPYHWHSIVAAQKISYINDVVCIHRKFATRSQITNISDSRRLMVFEALRYTQERIMHYPAFSEIKQQWINFSVELIDWAKERIPSDMHEKFNEYKEEFINSLPN
ncbi:TPA: glycosyltransferase, partial [Escherichia coli]|nr:glycosyltransferase [Escherichia coli]